MSCPSPLRVVRRHLASQGPVPLKCEVAGEFWLMDIQKDEFVHFTPRERALDILVDGKLLMRPPHPKFGIDAVSAVSTVWGRYVPRVQTTHLGRTDDEMVAVLFRTNTLPKYGYSEEVVWDRDVVFTKARIIPAQQAVAMLKGKLEGQVRYSVPSWCTSPGRVATRYANSISWDARNEGVRFTYKGFPIINQGLGDDTVKQMLGAIDHMISLFKKRGVEKALSSSLKGFNLVYEETWGGGTGQFFGGWIDISAKAILEGGQQWLQRTFLHEFGHHIYDQLPSRAQEEWRAPWLGFESAERLSVGITPDDRVRFVNLTARNGWDFQKAARTLSGMDRIKFLWWLYHPGGNAPLISSPNQVRLTREGRDLQYFFQHGYAEVEQREADRSKWFWLIHLGVKGGASHSDWELPEAVVKQIQELSPVPSVADLQVPTEYASTNYGEDFAETFVAFMVNPNTLSDVALHRIQRTLSLAGLYGKPVMRLAHLKRTR